MADIASIKSKQKRSPFKLRVVVTEKGVFWDKLDVTTNEKQFLIHTSQGSARRLAQWILDHTEE